jgi:broad specificity phosphatase PhoE
MLPRVYLVRHGETEWSASGRHTGRTDVPLTVVGEDEARELGARLQGIRFARVQTSPRQRAVRTCQLAGLGPVAEVDPDLAEWDYGDYEGQLSVDIHETRPDWNLFRDGCPGGESPEQVTDRADRVIARLRLLQGDIAVFSHGHFGRVLCVRWIGLSVRHAQSLLLRTASVSILSYEHGRTDQSAIAVWNATGSQIFGSESRPRVADTTMKARAIERWENEGGEICR